MSSATSTGVGARHGRLPIIRGRLLGVDGAPVIGAVLTLLDAAGNAVGGGRTALGGLIDVLAPGPGHFALVVRQGQDALAAEVVVGDDGAVVPLDLRLGAREISPPAGVGGDATRSPRFVGRSGDRPAAPSVPAPPTALVVPGRQVAPEVVLAAPVPATAPSTSTAPTAPAPSSATTASGSASAPAGAVPQPRRAGRFLLLALPATLGSVAAWYSLVRWGGEKDMRRGLLTGGAPLMTMHGGGDMSGMDMSGMNMGGGGAHMGMTMAGAHPAHASMTMFGLSMDHPAWSLHYAGLFAVMWSIMIVAMMLPALLPAAREFLIAEDATAPAGCRFLGSVLVMWVAVGAAVYAGLATFQHYEPDPSPTALRIGAGVLLAVALFQFTRTKELMLTHVSGPFCCGAPGAARAGLRHAWRCVASCGPYMVAVALIGTMSIFWMAIFAIVMLAEQVLEVGTGRGTLVSRATGAGVGLVAMAVLFAPSTLPLVG